MKRLDQLCLMVRGKAWIHPDPGQGDPYRVVYQRAGQINQTHRASDGTPIQIRAYLVPRDPQTGAQLARRQVMREAVAAWNAADSTAREAARATATKRRLPLFQAWCSDWLNAHKDHTATTWDTMPTTWDAAATTWDDGNTAWDAQPQTDWDYGNTFWDTWPI